MKNPQALAARFVALAVKSSPWRRSASLATLAVVLGGTVSTAHATLLVYEPFEFTPGQSLDGRSSGPDAVGMIGVWAATSNGTTPYATTNGFVAIAANTVPGPLWKGTCTSVPQKGVYAGSPATVGFGGFNGNNPNNMWASRPLNPSITTNFTLGSTTWMSCVQQQNFVANNNYSGMTFSIGAGVQNGTGGIGDPATGRGTGVQGGPAVGIGIASSGWGAASPKYFIAGVWDNNVSDDYYVEENHTGNTGIQSEIPLSSANSTNPLWIAIAKIVWGDASNPTTVTLAMFIDGAALSEAAFDAFTSTNLQTVTSSINLDPATFTNISLGGGRFDCDELRIGTTFSDVVGLVPGAPGIYWAPSGQGGSGTWSSGANNWASIPNVVGGLLASSTNTLFFAGTNGTVTVNGTVTTGAGLQFSVDGYRLVPGSSTPQINLAGANAAANTITVATGTNTIGVKIGGAAGMTVAGLGTLILTNTGNTYSGGTVLSAGTLRFTAPGSLGSGNVTFAGGTLQYPPGSGASPIDVSAIINPVASGQAAAIDTDGYDVTFGTAIGGLGGLTKLGAGSLTLSAANTYAGPTTVGAGTLNISSASGVIATLNVPAGGTVNLGAGAVVGALNLTGGKVNLSGAGVQIGTLFASSGTFTNPSSYSLAVTNSANLVGIQLSLSGASSFTLNGADLLNPTTSAHRVATATGGTLAFVVQGLDAAIGLGSPGIPASAATAFFRGNGVWDLVNGTATDINNVYGRDNHAFHYVQVPAGDFDIKVHVTGVTNASAGLMARDSLVSRVGNSAGIWTGLGNSTVSSTVSNGVFAVLNNNAGVVTPWLEVTKLGNLVGMYSSEDGTNYSLVQEMDFSGRPWGATMYLGLDLINTETGGGSGAFDEVNFMGTAGIADLTTTEFALNGGAHLNLGSVMYVNKISTNGVALAEGCWAGSALTGANHIDPAVFTSTGTGIAVIPPALPLTITAPDITVTTTDPVNEVVVNYSPPVVGGGTPPYTTTNCVPASGSSFPLGTTTVTCMVTDSSCPFGRTTYSSFRVIVVPPAPVMNPAVDANTGFTLPGGVPTFTFGTVAGFKYRVVYTENPANPLSTWLPLVSGGTDPDGWVGATGAYTTIIDPSTVGAMRFYRVEAAAP